MKRLDALVLKELLGPWIFGVSMFTMLLLASIYLGKIANYVVQGVPGTLILKVTLLLLPAILVKTFAMALLLGALLAFGRLSGDSEITAIRAAGVSLYRIVLPVSIFSLIVAGAAFWTNENLVPGAARQSAALIRDIAANNNTKSNQPLKQTIVQGGKLVAMIGARDFSLLDKTLRGVHIVTYDKSGHENYIMFAKELHFDPSKPTRGWEISGGADILSRDGDFKAHIGDIWPKQIPTITSSPDDLFAGMNKDLDIYSMAEIQDQIRKGEASGNMTIEDIRNYEYGFWNKIALPLAAFIFGTLGATLGIRNHRTGSATGFAISVAIIFSYFTLANFMNVYALGGVFPPYIASFSPIAIGLVASGVIIWRRNR